MQKQSSRPAPPASAPDPVSSPLMPLNAEAVPDTSLLDSIDVSIMLAEAPGPGFTSAGIDSILLDTPIDTNWGPMLESWDFNNGSSEDPLANTLGFSFNDFSIPLVTEQSPSTDSDSNETVELELETINSLFNPAPSQGLTQYSHPAFTAFQFSPDHEYYRYLCNGSITGFQTLMPIVDLMSDDRLASPYLYSAALAISALSVSSLSMSTSNALSVFSSNPVPRPVSRKHALRHYTAALASLSTSFPSSSPESFRNIPMDELLGWLMTRLLLSNIDLRLGFLRAWRSHLRAVGRVISAWHSRISQSPQGKSLIHTFARMALLLELQNEDFAVTKQGTMNPCVAAELSSLIEQSSSPRDRLLALIRSVSKLEIKYRLRPEKEPKWIAKMQKIEAQLFEWQRTLPSSELPVDTGISISAPQEQPSNTLLTPLTFLNSSDPYTAAVNYAHFLCARMRSRTRYGPNSELIPPSDAETAVLYICRIAAGLDPSNCKQADAYGHGMMPAIVGAYRWSSDEQMRSWIINWLKGYGGIGAREGLWDVDRTRRLLLFIDEKHQGVAYKEWHLIIARIIDDGEDEGESARVDDRAWNDFTEETQAANQLIGAETDTFEGDKEFKVVMYTRSNSGPATQYFVVS